jgi:uncharacterized repeat protein (TIGR01451 family)
MKTLKRIGQSLGILARRAAGYVSGTYVSGNYVQSGGYTGARPQPGGSTTMSVAITDSADPVITGGDAYSYSVTLTNTGSVDATSVSVAITLDPSLTYVSASGTGWACSQSGGVVTATRATAPAGAQPAITINVTTGGSALSASSSVVASAANASNATASQGTTVQLVSKDALAGIYTPASSAEWSRFIARKGLSVSAPDAIWLLQEDGTAGHTDAADASGNGFTLTAAGTLAYQQTVSGWSRKAITFTDGSIGQLKSTSASLPDISTTSQTMLAIASILSTPAAIRNVLTQGTTRAALSVTTTPRMRVSIGPNTADGTLDPTGAVKPFVLRTNVTAGAVTGFTDAGKVSPTYTPGTGQLACIGRNNSNSPAMAALYAVEWHASKAEISDANLKALLQAMGFVITWS